MGYRGSHQSSPRGGGADYYYGGGGGGGLFLGAGGEVTSDSDMELQTKRLKFLTGGGTRSRSSSPCSSSSPRTPGGSSWDSSSPRAASSSADSHWGFPSPKVFNLSRSFGLRLGFKRSGSGGASSGGSSSGGGGSTLATASSIPGGEATSGSGGGRPEQQQQQPPAPVHRAMLEQLPADEERDEYLTVLVGERSGRREKYVINKQLLNHHLFQTLMKCSEDMVGAPDYRSKVLLFCDPALFIHLVGVVGADLGLEHA